MHSRSDTRTANNNHDASSNCGRQADGGCRRWSLGILIYYMRRARDAGSVVVEAAGCHPAILDIQFFVRTGHMLGCRPVDNPRQLLVSSVGGQDDFHAPDSNHNLYPAKLESLTPLPITTMIGGKARPAGPDRG